MHTAAQHAIAARQHVLQLQWLQACIHGEGGGEFAAGHNVTLAQPQRHIAGIGLPVDVQLGRPRQRALAQTAAQIAHLHLRQQPLRGAALLPVGLQLAGDGTRPIGGEIAGIKASQLRADLPLQGG